MKSHELFDTKPVEALLKRHTDHTKPYLSEFQGHKFLITPDVFNPSYTKVSAFLAQNVVVNKGESVLDMFCGCGAIGLVKAAPATVLVGVDISGRAIACSRENARLLGQSSKTDFRLGSVWGPIYDWEKFDVIIANPPLLPAVPENILEMAVADSPDMRITMEFIAGLPLRLSEKGRGYMAFSTACAVSVGDPLKFLGTQADRAKLQYTVLDEWDVGYEIYRVIEFRK